MTEISDIEQRKIIQHHAKRDQVVVEVYKDFEITFDKRNATFNAFSDRYDTESNRKSFAAAKKYIDDFLKENTDFIRFKVTRKHHYDSNFGEAFTVVGRRKDGGFRAITASGTSQQISKNDLQDYVLSSSIDKDIVEKVMIEYSKMKAIKERIKALDETQNLITIKQHLQNQKS